MNKASPSDGKRERIVVIGSAAGTRSCMQLAEPLRAGAHLNGATAGWRPGGGGPNTAIALAAPGYRVTLLAVVGRDPSGKSLLAELEAAGVDTSQVARLARANDSVADPGGPSGRMHRGEPRPL